MHARADGQGRPLGFVLTGGEVSDYTAVPQLMAMPATRPRLMIADKGYDGDAVRSGLLMHGILPVIPLRKTDGTPSAMTVSPIATATASSAYSDASSSSDASQPDMTKPQNLSSPSSTSPPLKYG
nr:transposase [Eilatimonas milleporae]